MGLRNSKNGAARRMACLPCKPLTINNLWIGPQPEEDDFWGEEPTRWGRFFPHDGGNAWEAIVPGRRLDYLRASAPKSWAGAKCSEARAWFASSRRGPNQTSLAEPGIEHKLGPLKSLAEFSGLDRRAGDRYSGARGRLRYPRSRGGPSRLRPVWKKAVVVPFPCA